MALVSGETLSAMWNEPLRQCTKIGIICAFAKNRVVEKEVKTIGKPITDCILPACRPNSLKLSTNNPHKTSFRRKKAKGAAK